MTPRVSVVIPAYNAELSIVSAIQSAQEQSMRDIEIIIIDDASTDATARLVLAGAGTDDRLRLIRRQTNGGPAAARNDGLRAATGEWIALLDADDTIARDRFERLLAATHSDDVLVADNLCMYDRAAQRIVGVGITPALLGEGLRLDAKGFVARCKTNQPDAIDFGLLKPLIRRSCILATGVRYDEQMRYGEDFRFYLDVLVSGGSLLVVPDAMYRYTERVGSVSGQGSGLSKTLVQFGHIEQQARSMAKDPLYASVSSELADRADAVQQLARIMMFRRRPSIGKVLLLPRLLTDRGMRIHFGSRLKARMAKVRSRLQSSALFRDTSNLCVGQGIKLILQAIYFVLIGRCLGPSQFGAFAAIAAMTAVIAPFVGIGCGPLFLKNVRAGKRSAAVCWGNGLLATIATGALSTFVVLAIAAVWLPQVAFGIVAAICISDLIFARVIDLASFGFAASGQIKKTAVQNTTMSVLRVAGILLLALMYRRVNVEQWAWVYLATSIAGGAFSLQQGTALWGAPRASLASLWRDLREGCFFSVSTSAQTIYNDIDKTMLARYSTFSATGMYAAAYRVIDTSLVPVRALVSAAYPEFFRIGTGGLPATYAHARRMIRRALVFGVADVAGLLVLAPLLPYVLGHKYADVVPAIRILAVIPIARCIHWFLADALSGANAQGVRTGIQIVIAAINVGLNVLILPRWSWVGAAWTSVVCDSLLVLAVFIAIRVQLVGEIRVKRLIDAVE